MKPLDTKAWGASLIGSTWHVFLHIVAGKFSVAPCDTIERDTQKLAPGLSWTSPHVPLPFADLTPCPLTATVVIRLLSPVSPGTSLWALPAHNAFRCYRWVGWYGKTNNYGDQKGESLEGVLGAECRGFSDQVGSFHFNGKALSFVSFDTKSISMFPRKGNEVNTGYIYITGNFADLGVLTLPTAACPSRTSSSRERERQTCMGVRGEVGLSQPCRRCVSSLRPGESLHIGHFMNS